MPSGAATSTSHVPFLIAGMLLTGCANSLLNKWQDMQCVESCDSPDPAQRVHFEQPVWQTLTMFVGEFGCFLPVLYNYWLESQQNKGAPRLPLDDEEEEDAVQPPTTAASKHHQPMQDMQGWRYVLLWIPAACDLCGTTLMNVGLIYTPVSIYQMTRGALVLWVGLFSVMFLHRKLWLYQWLALVTVMIGVSIVGLSGSLIKQVGGQALSDSGSSPADRTPAEVFMGVLFVLFAQLFTAAQFVIEEKLMAKYSVAPLVAVGFEGLFGILSILLSMPFLSLYSSQSAYFDFPRGWNQIVGNSIVLWSSFAIMLSIAMFNAFGLSVTRSVSATARSTTDTCRTIGIWIVSLYLGWEILMWPFSALQVLGFALLVYGTFLFNNLVHPPKLIRPTPIALGVQDPEQGEEARALLAENSLEETAALPADLGQSGYDVVPVEQTGRR